MEFHQQLQELRKQKGLTQEELAGALFVSRTAVSKWESGRGYPSIDSLKAIAAFFGVTVDQLLSGDELLSIAEEDERQQRHHTRDLVFGLLDMSACVFLILPLFGQTIGGHLQSVSLLSLDSWLRAVDIAVVVAIITCGVLTLAMQTYRQQWWVKSKTTISVVCNAVGVLLFIGSLQPYAATLLFIFLMIKVLLLLKKP